jgi:SAM-dependent methyltransferase
MEQKPWFEEWFDSPYYHLLYQHRNDSEAAHFIGNLMSYLNLPANAHLLDLACGKGRHSLILANMGYQVTGVDLSPNSILAARKFESQNLSFEVQDMRLPFADSKFDAVLNLFTSFGYFDDLSDNHKVISSIRKMLKAGGVIVIDFMNSNRIVKQLVDKELINIQGISFHIEREYNGSHIFKHIRFKTANNDFHFTERVQALLLSDFMSLLDSNGFEIIRTFGDFDLNEFDPETSDRLLVIAKKS